VKFAHLLAAIVIVLALVIGGGAALRRPAAVAPPAPPPRAAGSAPAPPSSAERALVAPLAPGSDLAGFSVREIRGVEGGVMRVVCVKGKAEVRLDLALADEEGPTPPAVAGRYAVFYAVERATPEEGEKLAKALAKVVEKNAAAPPPAGMAPFTPRPKPGMTL
jgi:hypothetical protein